MNAVIEASSVIVPPETFPFCSSFSFDEATLGPLTPTGTELEEFPTVEAFRTENCFLLRHRILDAADSAEEDPNDREGFKLNSL